MVGLAKKVILAGSILVLVVLSAACSSKSVPAPEQGTPAVAVASPVPTQAPTDTPPPPRNLTICMGSEPSSLFLYGDNSLAARSVRQAIYDGPFDEKNYEVQPVLLEKKPGLADGDARLEAVPVAVGAPVVDASGILVKLGEGVLYRPAGCKDVSCALAYTGKDPVQMDQLVVQYKLRPGLQWSDGAPLSADDSLYSYEVVRALFPTARADLLARTAAYQKIDEQTLEWRGLPGFRAPHYPSNFFTPLPRHAWGELQATQLLTAEVSARAPIGWGPYRLVEWTSGDHLTLEKNPVYFRSAEGLPKFDRLVFRFLPGGKEALAGLLAGECDLVDETGGLEGQLAELEQAQSSGKLDGYFAPGSAWEHLDFGVSPLDAKAAVFFKTKEVRQAVALCLDRQKLAAGFPESKDLVADSYIPASHPLANPDVRRYAYDPAAAAALLQAAGWVDTDQNPATPRISQGVTGVPNGTPFQVSLLAADDADKQPMLGVIKDMLGQCGIQVDLLARPWEEVFAPGPAGPVFGRNFQLAQFAWNSSMEPPCYLYTTAEIPGLYPASPKGWGGANASGYSSQEYDRLCQQALNTLPDDAEHAAAHRQAQALFAEELPALPLFWRQKVLAARPDMCPITVEPGSENLLWNLEMFDYGEQCSQ